MSQMHTPPIVVTESKSHGSCFQLCAHNLHHSHNHTTSDSDEKWIRPAFNSGRQISVATFGSWEKRTKTPGSQKTPYGPLSPSAGIRVVHASKRIINRVCFRRAEIEGDTDLKKSGLSRLSTARRDKPLAHVLLSRRTIVRGMTLTRSNFSREQNMLLVWHALCHPVFSVLCAELWLNHPCTRALIVRANGQSLVIAAAIATSSFGFHPFYR